MITKNTQKTATRGKAEKPVGCGNKTTGCGRSTKNCK